MVNINHQQWLKTYIGLDAEIRKDTANEFEKDFCELLHIQS